MGSANDYDVIIIGTGAGGGTLAHALAPSGLRVLVLERGDFIPRERENWEPAAVFEEKRYLARETWYDERDEPFQPYTHYCVGGNTKVYGAALLRMREHDFGEVRHFGGVSPAWPLSYEEFEPYYTRAERLYSVRGERGADPCEPRGSAPFPRPPLRAEPRIAELRDDIARLGFRPFPIPLGVRIDDADPTPYHLGNFDGYPDPTEMKSDSHVVCVREALKRRNVTLLTRARAVRLLASPSGREVAGVEVERDGERFVARAGVVVAACGAINSAALLLRSACDAHPDGLANSSGLVGRNYMTHQNGCFVMVSSERNPSKFQKHFGMTDFYRGDGAARPPLGTIQLMGKPDLGTLAWLRGDKLPGADLAEVATRTIDFFLTAEDLPDPENRVMLRDDGSIRIVYRRNNTEAYDRLAARLEAILREVERRRGRAEPVFLHERLGVAGVSHQNGTLRFGRDPSASVLDPDCRAHDVENLYVVDGSFFPSSSAVNPSLTIMANALRVADRLLERFGTGVREVELKEAEA